MSQLMGNEVLINFLASFQNSTELDQQLRSREAEAEVLWSVLGNLQGANRTEADLVRRDIRELDIAIREVQRRLADLGSSGNEDWETPGQDSGDWPVAATAAPVAKRQRLEEQPAPVVFKDDPHVTMMWERLRPHLPELGQQLFARTQQQAQQRQGWVGAALDFGQDLAKLGRYSRFERVAQLRNGEFLGKGGSQVPSCFLASLPTPSRSFRLTPLAGPSPSPHRFFRHGIQPGVRSRRGILCNGGREQADQAVRVRERGRAPGPYALPRVGAADEGQAEQRRLEPLHQVPARLCGLRGRRSGKPSWIPPCHLAGS